jgi:hypothetical protein
MVMRSRSSHRSCLSLLLALSLAFGALQSIEAKEVAADSAAFYVAVDGDDSNPGTKDKPFATLARARDAVRGLRKAKPDEDITVLIRGGTYQVTKTIVFGLEDSGSENQTITYAAYPDEEPIFTGGRRMTGWRKLTEYPAEMPRTARGNVWVADVPETKGGKWRFLTLFDGDKMLPRASMKGFSPTEPLEIEWWQGRYASNEECSVFRFPKGAMKDWPNLEDVEIRAFPAGYTMNMLGLASVDEETGTARTSIPATYPLKAWPSGEPSVWVENVIDGLDAPGEWVLNTQQGRLYLWPWGDSPSEGIVAPALTELIRVEGDVDHDGPVDKPVRYLTFGGLTFTHGDRDLWTNDDAGVQHDWEVYDKPSALVRFRATEHCLVDECRFTNTGGTGLRFDLHSQYNCVQRSLFEYLGEAGVVFCGYGPGTKDVSHHNEVVNNRIHHCGEIYKHGHGIIFWCSGENRIAHNLIHDTPRKAVSVSGPRPFFFNPRYKERRECSKLIRWHEIPAPISTEEGWQEKYGRYGDWNYTVAVFNHVRNNVVEYNEAHHVLGVGRDGAAINMTGTGEGNIIRRNYIHNITNPGPDGVIRLDTAARATVIAENVIYKVPCIGIVWNDANNNVENNVIVDAARNGIYFRHGPAPGRVQRNVIYRSADVAADFVEHETETHFIDTLREIEPYPGDFNLLYDAGNPAASEAALKGLQEKGTDKHSISADPLFVDVGRGNLRLRPGSPAFKLGFKQIDMDKIGLREDFPERYR